MNLPCMHTVCFKSRSKSLNLGRKNMGHGLPYACLGFLH